MPATIAASKRSWRHGFRLPSAMDNRPLRFEEWEKRVQQVMFMSATPAAYELERCGGEVVAH